jgi:hypothetical protein
MLPSIRPKRQLVGRYECSTSPVDRGPNAAPPNHNEPETDQAARIAPVSLLPQVVLLDVTCVECRCKWLLNDSE